MCPVSTVKLPMQEIMYMVSTCTARGGGTLKVVREVSPPVGHSQILKKCVPTVYPLGGSGGI